VIERLAAREGDRLLLCTDGVSDYVSDPQIAQLLRAPDAQAAANQLVQLALRQGGRDNVTAVIADLAFRTDPRDGWLDYLPLAGPSA
jgi:serine/threonine protein phosphatase PrpC